MSGMSAAIFTSALRAAASAVLSMVHCLIERSAFIAISSAALSRLSGKSPSVVTLIITRPYPIRRSRARS